MINSCLTSPYKDAATKKAKSVNKNLLKSIVEFGIFYAKFTVVKFN